MLNPEIGVSQGYKSYFLQDQEGQLAKTHSISAGLDYAGIAPEIAFLQAEKRINVMICNDEKALKGLKLLAKTEGIIPALESAHAIGILADFIPTTKKDEIIVVNLSGRGDKDLFITANELGNKKTWQDFLVKEINKIKI